MVVKFVHLTKMSGPGNEGDGPTQPCHAGKVTFPQVWVHLQQASFAFLSRGNFPQSCEVGTTEASGYSVRTHLSSASRGSHSLHRPLICVSLGGLTLQVIQIQIYFSVYFLLAWNLHRALEEWAKSHSSFWLGCWVVHCTQLSSSNYGLIASLLPVSIPCLGTKEHIHYETRGKRV